MPLTNPPPPVVGTPPTYFTSPMLGSENPTTLNAGILPTTTFANSTAPLYAAFGSGGGGGAVDSVSAGNGLTVAPTTGAVVVSMPNVGPGAGAIANPASITLDAQGRVSAAASLGYTPVAPAALAAYAPLAGAVFTGAVQGIAPVGANDFTTKQWVDDQIVAGGGVQSVTAANASITVAGTAANPTLAVATQAGVTPGAYTNANVTVNSAGVITAVTSGSAAAALAAGTNIALDTTTTPGTTIIKQDITSAINMNTNEINNTGNISAPIGAQLDIKGGEINLVQSASALESPPPIDFPFPSVMNLSAVGGIGITAGGGVGIAAGGAVAVTSGALLSLTSGGSVSIGSANILGATTEVEHVSFKDNEISCGTVGEKLVITEVDTINTVTFGAAGSISAPGAVNGASVTATSGNVQALTGSIIASGAGPGQGNVEATQKVIAPFGDIDTVFTGEIQLGDNAGVNELTFISNEPGTHIVTAIEEGAAAGQVPGGMVDTRINPVTASLTGSTLNIGAKNGAGVATNMASIDLAPIIPAVPAGISQYATITTAPGTYAVSAAQANSALFFDLTADGNLNVTLPNGVPNGTMFFIGLPYNTAAGSQLTVFPVGGGIGGGRETVIKAANGGCLYIANGTVAGNVMYIPTDTGAYLALTGGSLSGALIVEETTNIEAKNITTALLTPLPSVGYISALGPMQVEGGNFLVANPAGSEIGLAASANPPVGQVATITYNYTNDDLIHLNKVIEAPGAVLDGNDVVPLLTFKDARTFYVSKQGSDSNSGAANEPFLTVQAAVTAAIATADQCILEIAPGTYTENITIPSVAGLVLQGTLASDRCVEGTILKGTIAVQCNTTDNMNNNQVVIADCFVTGHIHDTSTKQHNLIVQNCRIEANAANGGKAVQVELTATDGRTFISNCVITQEVGTTGTNPLISANVGFLDMSQVQATVRAEGCAVTVTGSAIITRMTNCALTSDSASANPNALVFLNSTTATPHAMGLTSFIYSVATSKTTPAILATRPSAGSIFATLANCVFGIAGTLAAGNVVQYTVGTALVLLVAGNRSLNTAAAPYASQIQSGTTVLPLSMVGETSVSSFNGLNGAVTLAAGSGLSLAAVGNTITLTNTRAGTVTGVGAGSGIAVDNTNPAVPVVSNTGVTRLIAGTNVSLTAETGSITISASGGGGGGGNVDTVSAGTGITLTGTAQDVIVNNAGVLSVGVGTGLVNTGTASDPVIAISGTGTITTQVVDVTKIQASGTGSDYSTFGALPRIGGSYIPPTEPNQLVPLQYVSGIDTGVLSVTAADSSINVGGTAANPTVSVAASGVSGGTYTNATVTVQADGRVTACESGTAPVTAVTAVLGETTSTGGVTPAIGLANAGTAGIYAYPSAITTDIHGRVVAATAGTQPITEVNAGTGISVSGAAGSVTIANDGVLSVAAGDASITVGGTASAPTVELPAQVITPGVYDWASVTVNEKGIVTAIAGSQGGAVPYTTLNSGTGVEVVDTGLGAATFNNTGVVSLNTKTGGVLLEAGTNMTIDNSVPGVITLNASGGGGGGVDSVSGTVGQITVSPTTGNAVVGLATFGAGEATYNIAGGSIGVDDYGRIISVTGSDQTTLNTKSGAITLAAGTNVTIDNSVPNTITINASGGGGGGVASVAGTGGIAVDNTDPANPIVSIETLGGLTPGDYVAPNISVNSKGQITFASSGTYGIVNSVQAGNNISVDSTDPYAPIIALNGISGSATNNVQMGVYTLTGDSNFQAKNMYSSDGYLGHWVGFGNTWVIPSQDADAPGQDSLRIVKYAPDETEVPDTSAILYSERYNQLVTTPFATAPSTVAPIGTTINNAGVSIVSGVITLNNTNWNILTPRYFGILGSISLVTATAQPLRFTITGQITGKASMTFVGQYVSEGQYHTVPLNNISFGFGTNGLISQGNTLTITVRCATITSLATTTIATAVPVLPIVLSPLSV